jgi:hypothetical protein
VRKTSDDTGDVTVLDGNRSGGSDGRNGTGLVAVGTASSKGIEVVVRRREGIDVLEARAVAGGVLGHFDPRTGRLHVVNSVDSVRVAAAVAPYLLGGEQPFGDLSDRHLHAADRLWSMLELSPYSWQRSVPLRDRLLLFYCPLIRIALEIVDHGDMAADVDAPMLNTLGLALAVIPVREIERNADAVATWLGQVCTQRAANRPGTQADGGRPAWRWTSRRRDPSSY